jgi:hypothetical protein
VDLSEVDLIDRSVEEVARARARARSFDYEYEHHFIEHEQVHCARVGFRSSVLKIATSKEISEGSMSKRRLKNASAVTFCD